jgi:ATP-dependent DNA ligase
MTCGASRLRCARDASQPARSSLPGVQFNAHLTHPGDLVFENACKMGLEGIVSKRLGATYRSGRSPDWLKFKNPEAPAVRQEAEEDWGR